MDGRQKDIIAMMDHTFGLDTLRLVEEGNSLTALYNLAAYVGRKLKVAEPDPNSILNDPKVCVGIKGMDVHDGTGGIKGFCGWGKTAEDAAENYLATCADAIQRNIDMYKRLEDETRPGRFKETMGFCLDLSQHKRFDFVTPYGEGLPSLAESATVLDKPVKPFPRFTLRK